MPAALGRVDFLPDRALGGEVASTTLHADRQGRLRILRGSEVFALYARHEGASALVDVRSALRQERQDVHTVKVRLRSKIDLCGCVVTPEGKPPGTAVPLMVGISLDSAAPGVAEASERGIDVSDLTKAHAVEVRDPKRVQSLLASLLINPARAVPVGQDGSFRCLVDDLPVEYEFCPVGLVKTRFVIGRVQPREQPHQDLRLVWPK